jgi:hypothetical protein
MLKRLTCAHTIEAGKKALVQHPKGDSYKTAADPNSGRAMLNRRRKYETQG